MTIDQLSIFVENSPGRLAEITGTLADAGIDLRAMSIADTKDFGILRVIVNDPGRAGEVLRSAGCVFSVTKVLAVSIDDKPGSLSRILGVLAGENISIEYIYAFITRKKDNAYVIFRVEDNDRAVAAFTAHGVKTAGANELYEL
ncbi:MAG: ACT domain-containing protein [Clostridiales Family XIII bacterium]|nr:ACT domain-containing protein [Clostridiales Family XIII bacterium]